MRPLDICNIMDIMLTSINLEKGLTMAIFRNGRPIEETELNQFTGDERAHARADLQTIEVGCNRARRNKTLAAMRELKESGRNPVWGSTRSRNRHYR